MSIVELLDDHCRFCTFPTTLKQNESINNIDSGRYAPSQSNIQAPGINVTESDITTTVERKK